MQHDCPAPNIAKAMLPLRRVHHGYAVRPREREAEGIVVGNEAGTGTPTEEPRGGDNQGELFSLFIENNNGNNDALGCPSFSVC